VIVAPTRFAKNRRAVFLGAALVEINKQTTAETADEVEEL
jgi:hypothetical protein